MRAHPDEIASQGAERHYDCAEVREEPPDGGAEMAGKLRRGKPEKRRYYKEQKGALFSLSAWPPGLILDFPSCGDRYPESVVVVERAS